MSYEGIKWVIDKISGFSGGRNTRVKNLTELKKEVKKNDAIISDGK